MRIIREISGRLPIKLMVIVLAVVVVGLGVTKVVKGRSKKGAKEPVKQIELSPWKLEEFVVNLRDANDARYLKVNIVLGMEGKVEAGEGGNPDEPAVRDTIITVLTAKSYSDLESPAGKEHLKDELKKALNDELEKTKVGKIYFTSFAMQ
jgi:flagellar protein FliL